jgi:hypothetical protein
VAVLIWPGFVAVGFPPRFPKSEQEAIIIEPPTRKNNPLRYFIFLVLEFKELLIYIDKGMFSKD